MAYAWTLADLKFKIRNDLELSAENFITDAEMTRFINDAIEDAEEAIINSFSDFFLTFSSPGVTAGNDFLEVPADIYQLRVRALHYDEHGFRQDTTRSVTQWYKVKKVPLEEMAVISVNDEYRYRITNSGDDGLMINIYPTIRKTSQVNFRIYYIRQAKRLSDDTDVLEPGIRPQYILSHAKQSCLKKEGDPIFEVQAAETAMQHKKLIDSISRMTDDSEDEYLEPDFHSLSEAFGEYVY